MYFLLLSLSNAGVGRVGCVGRRDLASFSLGGQTMACGPSMFFTFSQCVNGLKIIKRIIFSDSGKLYAIQISVSTIQSFTEIQPCSFVYLLSVAAFVLQG